MRYTDFADEIYVRSGENANLPRGVRFASAQKAGLSVTRVEILREGLLRPKGRYITVETPSLSLLDARDAAVIDTAAEQLRSLIPKEGKVLVVGVGNRRVTADSLGPRTVQHVFVTAQHTAHDVQGKLRAVCAVSPGVCAATGVALWRMVRALVQAERPVAVLCVDSLVSGEAQRLGRTLQFSNTGLCPADENRAKELTQAQVGVRVIAAGIPTLMEVPPHDAFGTAAQNFVCVPRELDDIIAHGSALLGAAINRALQPDFSLEQLCWLAQ